MGESVHRPRLSRCVYADVTPLDRGCSAARERHAKFKEGTPMQPERTRGSDSGLWFEGPSPPVPPPSLRCPSAPLSRHSSVTVRPGAPTRHAERRPAASCGARRRATRGVRHRCAQNAARKRSLARTWARGNEARARSCRRAPPGRLAASESRRCAHGPGAGGPAGVTARAKDGPGDACRLPQPSTPWGQPREGRLWWRPGWAGSCGVGY